MDDGYVEVYLDLPSVWDLCVFSPKQPTKRQNLEDPGIYISTNQFFLFNKTTWGVAKVFEATLLVISDFSVTLTGLANLGRPRVLQSICMNCDTKRNYTKQKEMNCSYLHIHTKKHHFIPPSNFLRTLREGKKPPGNSSSNRSSWPLYSRHSCRASDVEDFYVTRVALSILNGSRYFWRVEFESYEKLWMKVNVLFFC